DPAGGARTGPAAARLGGRARGDGAQPPPLPVAVHAGRPAAIRETLSAPPGNRSTPVPGSRPGTCTRSCPAGAGAGSDPAAGNTHPPGPYHPDPARNLRPLGGPGGRRGGLRYGGLRPGERLGRGRREL